ncbi:hypothetical protein FE784_30895 [Paenibacillus hemerocallicola]|uniref:Uncharacterized protein n=1 Tax=Paenibacillus hemerocallicola TaxID=1172614 RepID=A0A5C4T023_9BACL|nr:hypothetical protein [Paenibacillus hemerocallicola]TNJ62381.1 hypothetical protein FE784_30895 [Paenibacillus hemerocallicola]
MKKSRYYPFERNRYFYGKLLTVRDFESEQKYFNDKRRMMNRLLFGAGVITGLQVIAVDDKSVSVEMGAAIDALGREIVVPAPVTLKLSMMDGFTNNEYAKNVYLCIAYDEKGKEPVHSIANSSVRSDEVSEYNRVLESYRLFIREEAPDPSSFPMSDLTEQTVVLYQDANVRILQITPKYVNSGQTFLATIRIEKSLQIGKIELQYELATNRAEAIEGRTVRFIEPQDSQETEYEFQIALRADGVGSGKALVGVKSGSAVLRVGDKQLDSVSKDTAAVHIISAPVQEQLMDDFLKQPLEASLDSPSDPCLYLAKIGLLQMGPTYVIERVDQVPFGEYVYNATASHRLALTEAKRRRSIPAAPEQPAPAAKETIAVSETEKKSYDQSAERTSPIAGAADIQSGWADIPVSPFSKSALSFGKAVKSFVSQEIEHGLGTGNVLIMTSLEERTHDAISDMLSSGQRSYFGAADVFTGSEFESVLPGYQLGVVSYPQKGTFRIGIKLRQISEARTIRVRWWAYRNGQEQEGDLESSPDIVTFSEAAAGSENKAD